MRMRNIICALSGCTNLYFPHYLTNGTISEKKKFTEYKMCGSVFPVTFVWKILHYKKNWARYSQYCISVFMWSAVIVVRS